MRRALRLARRGRGRVSPGALVGAVVVRDGVVAGEGAYRRRGGPHAEIEALAAAGERCRGATLYVTLEPCAHHGTTPPCAEAVAAAGISRVVCALEDPDERVRGRGFARLRDAGIAVEVGLLAPEAERDNAAFLTHRRTGKPWVVLKLAQSLDGRIATRTGASRWITGKLARRHAPPLAFLGRRRRRGGWNRSLRRPRAHGAPCAGPRPPADGRRRKTPGVAGCQPLPAGHRGADHRGLDPGRGPPQVRGGRVRKSGPSRPNPAVSTSATWCAPPANAA